MNNQSPSIIYERSEPMAIPRTNNIPDSKVSVEYNLTRHFFDPNKSSPPNSWNARLLFRLGESRREEGMQTNH